MNELRTRELKVNYTRLYTGADQQSHFEDCFLSLLAAEVGKITDPIRVGHVYFGELEHEHEMDWHNAPCRQYVILLEGAIEIELGDGTKRVFHVGDIILAEDLEGQGHITRSAIPGKRKYMFVTLD